ncbi:heterogeneous nuclear ribonucleoprotein L-like isoform X1 [Pocillopora verrucosa]|uniref:heterogeneous nuclear ribonucleoprotein L-like isoform X1 n=1 Tax=Pocillopora verrucosa TaxID=203993 RepID=UPI0027971917|nr:heterogeneous nuclear ribonucleoprotein L-like isoform X1 [Pocillopora verrucosa]
MADIGAMIATPGIESPNKRAKMDSGLTATNFDESKFARYYRTDTVSSPVSSHSGPVVSDTSAYYSYPYTYSNSFSSYTYPCGQTDAAALYTYPASYGIPYTALNGFSTEYSSTSGSDYSLSPSSSVSALTSTSSLNIPQSLTLNSTAHHNTPPSRVIHCRAVADGCKETDLINVLQPFGKITYVTLLPKIRQALVEFEDIDSAVALVSFSQSNTLTVLGRQMFVNYSKSQEIKRDKVLNGESNGASSEASNILLLTIINPLHPITVKVLHKICSPHGKVLRIVIFHKNGLQALVEFDNVEAAQRALATLNGQDIYAGCCTLKIDYSKKAKKLNVFKNDDETWDYTGALNNNSGIPSKTALLGSGLLSAISGNDASETQLSSSPPNTVTLNGVNGSPISISNEAIARAAQFPTVQSILAKVASLHGNPPKSPTSGSNSPVENVVKKLGILGSSPYQLPQGGLLGALPGLAQQQQQMNGISSALNAGGTGCVLMVYGLNAEKMNCERIFNLFCLYGNVVKVKFLTNKLGAAMVQMSDKVASEMIIRNLSGAVLFDSKINIIFSKHPFIADSSVVTTLPDGTPSSMNFADNRNNRFKYLPEGQSLKNRYQPPTRMLHFFNAPPNCTVETLKEVFITAGSLSPLKGTFFSKANAKSSAGLLEMPDIRSAMEALTLTNHFTINPPGGGSYTLKLAFSPSSSISPTAPTVAPAVAAAAVAVSNGANPLGPIGSPVHPRCMAGSPISIVTNGVKELNGDSERNGLSPEHLSGASP